MSVKRIVCSVVAVIGLVTGGMSLESSQPVGQVTIQGEKLGTLRISPKGLAIIGNAEGCIRSPYLCPAGLRTNGIGNTHGVPNHAVSFEQVAKDWTRNIEEAEQTVTLFEFQAEKRMTQGQFDAFTSFAFNNGRTRFMRNKGGSFTRIYRYIISGNYVKACHELPVWVFGGGKKLSGLIERREKEYARCMELD